MFEKILESLVKFKKILKILKFLKNSTIVKRYYQTRQQRGAPPLGCLLRLLGAEEGGQVPPATVYGPRLRALQPCMFALQLYTTYLIIIGNTK